MKLEWVAFALFFLAALIHVGFFLFEAVMIQKPSGARLLKMTDEAHRVIKPWALNQGFYNLFLAIEVFIGLIFIFEKKVMIAGVLVGFSGLSMLFAGVVLWFSVPHMRKFALLQAIPPALGFFFLYFHVKGFIG